jgi:hypothetical protein
MRSVRLKRSVSKSRKSVASEDTPPRGANWKTPKKLNKYSRMLPRKLDEILCKRTKKRTKETAF